MISINATLVVQLINFLVLLYILNRILFTPILKGLEERASLIEGSKEKAKELLAKGEEKLQEYNQVLVEAAREASIRKAEYWSQGSTDAAEIIRKAREEENNIRAAIRRDITIGMEEARKDLKRQAESLSFDLASKVLDRKIR